jgi:cytochrome P450
VDPETFDPSRFLVKDEDDPKKVHADMLHLVSFGGGASMCKGRLFAEREVLFFIAGLLTVWEFRLDQGFKIPERFYCGTGTANPKTPVRVRMSRRTW